MSRPGKKNVNTQESDTNVSTTDSLQRSYFLDVDRKFTNSEELAEKFFKYCNRIVLQATNGPTGNSVFSEEEISLVRKKEFLNWLKKIMKTFPDGMPKTFSRIVMWIKEERVDGAVDYITILEKLDKTNRTKYFSEVKKAQELAIAKFYSFIEYSKTKYSIGIVNKELSKLIEFGSFPKLSKKTDTEKLRSFFDECVIPLYDSKEISIIEKSELLYNLVLLFMSDYNKDDTKSNPLHKEIILYICDIVNKILVQEEEISDPTFIRCLVYLTDYCNLLGDKWIKPQYIIPSKFKFKAENGVNLSVDKPDSTITYLELDDHYGALREYLLFLDSGLRYVKEDSTLADSDEHRDAELVATDVPTLYTTSATTSNIKSPLIHSVAAIVGFKMRVDYFVRKSGELFGFLAEVDGPTHFQFKVIDRTKINPHTIIRDKIREAMLMKENTSKQAVMAKKDLLEELNSKVKDLEAKEETIKNIMGDSYEGMHINPVRQTLVVSTNRAHNHAFIQETIKKIIEGETMETYPEKVSKGVFI